MSGRMTRLTAPTAKPLSCSLTAPGLIGPPDGERFSWIGTAPVIEHVPYLADPALVRLLPGAAEALKRLRRAGFALVLVTNQSAIGRGMLTRDRLQEIHGELFRQLAASGATIDRIYYCPDAPVGDDRTVVEKSDRKPGPGMLLRAASDLDLEIECLLDGRGLDQRRSGWTQRRVPEHSGSIGANAARGGWHVRWPIIDRVGLGRCRST